MAKNNTENSRRKRSAFKIISASLCAIGTLLMSNLPLLNAFESHVIEVTANICGDSDANLISNWKENSGIYRLLLPQEIGNEMIDNPQAADDILLLANDENIRNQLRSQLLVLKFNIAYFEVDENFSEDTRKRTNEIASEADELLRMDPPPLFTAIETMEKYVEKTNYSIRSQACETKDIASINVTDPSSLSELVLINKIGLNLSSKKINKENNIWIELYNPKAQNANLKGWQICDSESCDVLSEADIFIPEYGYAIIAESGFDFDDWDVPDDVVMIILENKLCGGLEDESEMLALENNAGEVVDSLNWGVPDLNWRNYNAGIWDPGIAQEKRGAILKRIENGLDTDTESDWIYEDAPHVDLVAPNTGEVWWVGRTYEIKWSVTNYNSSDDEYKINIKYSNDNGETWSEIVMDAANTGAYEWRMPLFIDDYFTVSPEAKVKIIAVSQKNFMSQNSDTTENDLCPPIDYSLLTNDEKEKAIEIGLIKGNGMEPIIDDASSLDKASSNVESEQDIEEISDVYTDDHDEIRSEIDSNSTEQNYEKSTADSNLSSPSQDISDQLSDS